MNNRKTYLEFVRIFACLTVIFVHTHFYTNNLSIKLFIGQCGVPLFYMITGYALFSKNHDYKKLLKKALIKYILPILCLVTFIVIFSEWILGNQTIKDCFTYINLSDLIKSYLSVITLQFVDYKGLLGILWTFKFYLSSILFYPALKMLMPVKQNEESNICRRVIITLVLVGLFINTLISINIIKLDTIILLFPEVIVYLLLGYEFNLHKEALINGTKKGLGLGFIITTLGLLLKSYIYGINPSLYSSYDQQLSTLIYVIGLFILFSNIGLLFKQNSVINYISAKTYGIYLIHILVIQKINTTRLYREIALKVPTFSFKEQFLIELVYTLIVFILCLFITMIISKFIYIVKKVLKCSKKEYS